LTLVHVALLKKAVARLVPGDRLFRIHTLSTLDFHRDRIAREKFPQLVGGKVSQQFLPLRSRRLSAISD